MEDDLLERLAKELACSMWCYWLPEPPPNYKNHTKATLKPKPSLDRDDKARFDIAPPRFDSAGKGGTACLRAADGGPRAARAGEA